MPGARRHGRAKDTGTVTVNRMPVLTLWAAVVAQREGQPWETALTLGKAVAVLNAQSKGRRLRIYGPSDEKAREQKLHPEARPARRHGRMVEVLGREVPVVKARAVVGGKAIAPGEVERYLERSFGERLADVREAMEGLAAAYPRGVLKHAAYGLYEQFRPTVPAGTRGWGARGELDLRRLAAMRGEG